MPATRAAQGPSKPPSATSTNSSSSLSSRPTRTNGTRHASPPANGDTPHSRSSEDSQPPARRSQRAQTKAHEEPVKPAIEIDEEAVDEEEVTRCVCSQQEYPGPPLSEAFVGTDAQSEDAGGLFIQCDGCSVWQHGGCVGIVEESQSPDKYYCEECRPKQHEVHTDPRGQKYSLYLPLTSRSHRKGSISKPDEKARKDRENAISRASVDSVPGKRRPTIRSRENYEEEEQFRQAIEESKRDNDTGTTGRRNGKRAREEGEDPKQGIKRQRTASESYPSYASITHAASVEDDSGDEPGATSASRAKKAKSEATESARQAEMREREKERERLRAEQAGRRQARAGRRRGDESEAIEDTPKPSNSAKQSPPAPSSQPPSPPPLAAPPTEKVSHKKGAGKKTKKLGNNQYTKARDLAQANQAALSPHHRKRQLANTHADSGDEQQANGETGTSNSTSKNSPGHHEGNANNNNINGTSTYGPGPGKGKFGKGKGKAGGVNGQNTKNAQEQPEKNLANMTRAVDSMTAFIARAQSENSATPPSLAARGGQQGLEDAGLPPLPPSANAGFVAGGAAVDQRDWGAPDELGLLRPPTEGLSAAEMAELLRRNLQGFRTRFGSGGGEGQVA